MTIGVGVEGPSDRKFWDGVLHRHFPHVRFDIRSMGNRSRLVRETQRLIEAFRGLHYDATFIVVDRDDTPCVTALLEEFPSWVRNEARRPVGDRNVFVCVAIKELEAWYLADADAINSILRKSSYKAPEDTGHLGSERELKKLWGQNYNTTFNKIDFASQMRKFFDPHRAQEHSRSFRYFWKQLSDQCSR